MIKYFLKFIITLLLILFIFFTWFYVEFKMSNVWPKFYFYCLVHSLYESPLIINLSEHYSNYEWDEVIFYDENVYLDGDNLCQKIQLFNKKKSVLKEYSFCDYYDNHDYHFEFKFSKNQRTIKYAKENAKFEVKKIGTNFVLELK